jgi:glycine dehydrogenase subunit 2
MKFMSSPTIPTFYELSMPGRHGVDLPVPDVPQAALPASELRADCGLPEVSQLDVVRHYLALSQRNFGVDSGFYPLGSCTMKFNPKENEEIARIAGFALSHPLQEPETVQGNLAVMFELQQWLAEIGGFAAVSLQPAAGAHGELTGLLMMRAYHGARGDTRRKPHPHSAPTVPIPPRPPWPASRPSKFPPTRAAMSTWRRCASPATTPSPAS